VGMRVDKWDRYGTVKVYIGSACGLVRQVGHNEGIYCECVWFGGTGRAL